jgi:catechol 2,3-dioxygenase-like lactoylglutathione lyase family enzyme
MEIFGRIAKHLSPKIPISPEPVIKPSPKVRRVKKMIKVKHVDHIGLITKDRDAVTKFYTQVFGMQLKSEEDLPHIGIKNAMLECGGDTLIEVIQFTDGRDYCYCDGTYEFMSLRVEDIFEAEKQLKEAGAEMLQEAPIPMGEGEYFTFFRGPAGEKVEIVQKN